MIGRGQEQPTNIAYTPRAKKVIELSMDEARKLGHTYVGTEHILLGLIREGEGVAARVLNNLGISLNKARQQVLQLLGSSEAVSSNHGSPANVSTPTLDGLGKRLDGLCARKAIWIRLSDAAKKSSALFKCLAAGRKTIQC